MEAWLSGLKQRTANALTLKRGPEVRILPPPQTIFTIENRLTDDVSETVILDTR